MSRVKLTRAEWVAIIVEAAMRLHNDRPDVKPSDRGIIYDILKDALGRDKADAIVRQRDMPEAVHVRIGKNESREIVKAALPYIPGDFREAKIAWAVDCAFAALGPERAAEVVAYARETVEAYEAAGGTIDELPTPATVADPLFDAEWWSRHGENGAHWPVVGTCKVDAVTGSTFRITSDIRGGENFVAYFVERDGKLIGGKFDGLVSKSSGTKTWKNARTGYPGRFGPQSEAQNREKVKVRSGDKVIMCVGSANSKTRSPASNVVTVP
jgi:hypothetical protein